MLIDGAPARSCIAFAAACDGARVDTIEGLEHDPVMVRLRAAFTAEHGLQCGYCTPGMLVTARDIVQRLPHADEARIRLELAGNLCRCTGYAGIVRAIARVLAESPAAPPVAPPPIAPARFDVSPVMDSPIPAAVQGGESMTHRLRVAASLETVWQAVQNPELIAGCVPGAELTERREGEIAGEIALVLGPMQARFVGRATFGFGPGCVAWAQGEGRDRLSGTRLTARADVALHAETPSDTVLVLAVRYSLRGPLAQFARAAVVSAFAAEIAEVFAANLAARLAGSPAAVPARFGLGRLAFAVVRRWLQRLRTR